VNAMTSFVNLRALRGYSLPAWICLYAALGWTQTPRKLSPKDLPPSAFKLISIKVTGTKRYKPEDIIAASGLQIGQTVSEDDFKQAIRVLGETGAFTDLLYNSLYSPEGTKLELQVQDSEKFVPVRFDNVVWFSDQEMLSKLHAQVPLFEGELPTSGNLAAQVSQALQALLIEKHVQGEADYLRAAHDDGPTEAFVFSVSGPQIHIRNVEFSGAGPAELSLLQAAAQKLQGAEYARSALRIEEDKNFLPIYLERGYLKATFGDAQAKVVEDTPQETLVDVAFPVDPGRQYKLTAIEFSGNKSLPTETLRPLIHLQMNQPADGTQLENDIEAMKKLYGTRGFMEVSIQPEPEVDEAQAAVKYLLRITEGDVYKMGDLEIQGLDAHTTARLQNDWTLRGGDPYDSSYAKKFLAAEHKELSLMGEWNISTHESLNYSDKTVDVSLRFDPVR
jgi:outer membrane protein assembly factor BamA